MRIIENERAVYLIFPTDKATLVHSVDELAQIARAVDDKDDMFRPIMKKVIELEQRIHNIEGAIVPGKAEKKR